MKYKLRLIIIGVAFFCLSLPGALQATTLKKCFIDGNDVAEQTGQFALSYGFHSLLIGAEGNQYYRYNGLQGTIDEFAIYNGILSDPCIAAHANSLPANYAALVTADAPLLWLRFEDSNSANGATAADSSGNNQDGTYIGDDVVGDVNLVTGFVGTAAEFYGSDANGTGTAVNVDDSSGALELNDLTVEFWFKSTTLYDQASYPKFFQHNNGTSLAYGGMVSMQWDTNPGDPNDPVFGLIGGGSTEYDPVGINITDGQWHHIVFTYDSTPDPNYENLGGYATEVKNDHPSLYIRCDSLPLVDDSNNNYWVEASSAVAIARPTGSLGNCAYLNGGVIAAANQQTEPCLPADYNDSYAFGDGNALTVEMWLYYPPGVTVDTYATLWNQNASEDINGWSPGCQAAIPQGRIRCNENRSTGDGFAYTNNDNTWGAAGRWHHHVMTYQWSDSPAQLHVEWWSDNVQVKSSTYGTSVFDNRIGPVMDHIVFGALGSRDAPSGQYRQYMDEIAVYDHVLSGARIGAHYNAFAPQDCNEVWFRGIDEDLVPIDESLVGQLDRNEDCMVNFQDFAAFAGDWAQCNDPEDAGCTPNWPN